MIPNQKLTQKVQKNTQGAGRSCGPREKRVRQHGLLNCGRWKRNYAKKSTGKTTGKKERAEERKKKGNKTKRSNTCGEGEKQGGKKKSVHLIGVEVKEKKSTAKEGGKGRRSDRE